MKLSIITICFNACNQIERTITSVINQTYDDFEYIIIDGGSKDGTVELINKYRNSISTFISEPDKGIYDAMNKGIKLAKGEWVCMMNAGDVFTNHDVLKNVFDEHIGNNIKFLYSDCYSFNSKGQKVLCPLSYEEGKLIHQSTIYKKELHSEYGYYIVSKPIIISDYLFFIQVPKDEVQKLHTVISIYEGGGVSAQGDWAFKQAICADVVFRRRTFYGMITFYISKKIKSIIPDYIKDYIKSIYK
jgi:glycosyltransferase involved in cell wall biosynthesis